MMLGLAGGNTKKRGNKKSGECITPIRYNVLHMYIREAVREGLLKSLNNEALTSRTFAKLNKYRWMHGPSYM